MAGTLRVSIGQASDAGIKDLNQDFHGALIPNEPLLSAKGIALAVADGISSSQVSGDAAQTAIKSFLSDYYCTSEAWSVKTSAQRVLAAANSWLHAQNQRGQFRYDRDRGYVCTFSGMVLKSTTAHLFHVGDSRIYRLSGGSLEQLTSDHRTHVSSTQSYLSRALGVNHHLEIDHLSVPLEMGDVFLLTTDGLHDHLEAARIGEVLASCGDDLDRAARRLLDLALAQGSDDNLTLQIVRIDALPSPEAAEILLGATDLPLPPLLEARMEFDGYRIVRKIHGSHRSHIYLAADSDTGALVALKIPSVDLRDDPDHLKRLMMEEWVAGRLNSAHVLRPAARTRKRNYLYSVMEFIEGQTLAQWMIDNRRPHLETVRGIVEQVAKGLQAFHRMEMLHQDLRPENIMIDRTGTVKIIDFGSTHVAGVAEPVSGEAPEILGTLQYTAPEYFIGGMASTGSDVFSLGVITYQMLCGRLPYGVDVAKARTARDLKRIKYQSAIRDDLAIPLWIDEVLRKAVHPSPDKRYGELTELVYDLRHPNQDYLGRSHTPLLERNPLLFWKVLSLGLAATCLALLAKLAALPHP